MDNIIDAVENNDIEYLKNNLGKFDPNQIGAYGFSLLHRTAYFGYLEMIELLIDNGANVDILDEDHFTPLHSIIEGNEDNWFDTIELLIKKGANVNSYMYWRDRKESESKESILITAIKYEMHIEVIKLLLENGADVDFIDANGDKAINYAYDLIFYKAFELLKEYGAEYDGKTTKDEEILQGYAIGMEESYKLRKELQIKHYKKD